MDTNYNNKTLVVHEGLWHADDLFCVALWTIAGHSKYLRKDLQEAADDQILCDQGGGDWDHHGDETLRFYPDEDGCNKMASFGRMWEYLGPQLTPAWENIWHNQVKAICSIDCNGLFKAPIQKMVGIVEYLYQEYRSNQEMTLDESFEAALPFAISMINSWIAKEAEQLAAEEAGKNT